MRVLSVLFFVTFGFLPTRANAGECTETDDSGYVNKLKLIARGKSVSGDDPFACLDIRFGMTNRWAGPRAARKIRRFRKSKLREPIKEACGKILQRGAYWHSKGCLRLLAAYGVREINHKQTYNLLGRYFPYGMDPGHLAALGDPRAVVELIKRFDAEKSCVEFRYSATGKAKKTCRSFPKKRPGKWPRHHRREHKISVLNALYHLADGRSEAFLTKLTNGDEFPLVSKRAAAALAHFRELKYVAGFAIYLKTGVDKSSSGLNMLCQKPSKLKDPYLNGIVRRACKRYKAMRRGL